MAEPSDFKLQDQWFVMAHNLDNAGDVVRVAGPFSSRNEAEAEAQQLQHSDQSD